jgi:esterase/lipase superfamily enzyme
MNVEYHRWWSDHLFQDMEIKVYGSTGKPVLVFPAQGGRFYEFEDFGMVAAVSELIEEGQYTIYTVDSVDNQSWANQDAHPADRARRHEQYDAYIQSEVVPFINHQHQGQKILTTGCSMGGYHSANFFFRHPDTYDAVVSLSGLFSLRRFVGDAMNEDIYFNSPLDYLANLNDAWYLDQYRKSQIIICVGQGAWEDEMRTEAAILKHILESKAIPCWIDFWGDDVNHDWPWWRKQLPYFLGKLAEKDIPD